MALYELVDPKKETNVTNSLVSLILDELISFKHDYLPGQLPEFPIEEREEL